jgi:hypothetical protein
LAGCHGTNAEGAALAGLGQYANAESLLVSSLPNLAGSPLPGLEKTGRERAREAIYCVGQVGQGRQYQVN